MASSTEDKPTPAKASGTTLVKLASAGANDTFVVGDGEGALMITPQGVEVDSSKVEVLLEIAAYNGVTLVVTDVEKGK